MSRILGSGTHFTSIIFTYYTNTIWLKG